MSLAGGGSKTEDCYQPSSDMGNPGKQELSVKIAIVTLGVKMRKNCRCWEIFGVVGSGGHRCEHGPRHTHCRKERKMSVISGVVTIRKDVDGSNLNVHQQMNGLRCVYKQWNITQPSKRMKECHLQQYG